MHATAEKHYLVGHSSGGQGLVNNHLILNNEPRKEKHLENLESVLVFESLVCRGEVCGRVSQMHKVTTPYREPRPLSPVSQVQPVGDCPGQLPWLQWLIRP